MRLLVITTVLFFIQINAFAAPPIEAYGKLPTIRSVTLSPDGVHVAYLMNHPNGSETLNVVELGKGFVGAAGTDNVKTRDVYFAGPRHVILRGGATTKVYGFRGRFEFSGAYSFSLDSKEINFLPTKMEDLYPAQTGLGKIVALDRDGEHVLMPAFTGQGENPPYELIRVDLNNGRGRIAKSGLPTTIDWIVDPDGTVLAREDYNNKLNKYSVYSEGGESKGKIFEHDSKRIPFSLFGVKPDKSGLLLVDELRDENFSAVYELSFDGKISGPVFAQSDREIEGAILDINRVALGVEYSGLYPTYEFYDPRLTSAMASLQNYFSESSVYLSSWTDDFSKLLVYVEGTGHAGDYFVFHPANNGLQPVTGTRPDITAEDVARVLTIEYKARDGLKIPALLTLPLSGEPENAPLIVLPHGGPATHDSVGFDWMAQFFASRGYLVFQPNFRGSDGFGAAFRAEGHGEWGGKMQDDITDGVRALIASGRADPSRICIVGASYGGYAALAGGAYTPDLYQCVAAIAPVSDLPMMLRTERRDYGSTHWVVDYWQSMIGDPRAESDKLEAISPVNSAAAFQAPVLLIHGKDDTVVPIDQSRAMERALKSAKKEVEFITLKGEDHWLSTSDNRLETLKALDAFVKQHIGAN